MSGYYDSRKKKYVIDSKEFPDQPTTMDYVKEGFEDQNTKAQLEALRKRRQSNSNGQAE